MEIETIMKKFAQFINSSIQELLNAHLLNSLFFKRKYMLFMPWRRKQQPIPVFLPGKSHGQRSLEGYSPWGHKESDMTEQLSTQYT